MIKKIITFILLLLFYFDIYPQNLTSNKYWDGNNQGKDSVCNVLFESLLYRTVFKKATPGNRQEYYSIGYLVNIDFYYVSYMDFDEYSAGFATEFFKIKSNTDISSFDYTRTKTCVEDTNKNHFFLCGNVGKIDSYNNYIIFYSDRHIEVYSKNYASKKYDSVAELWSSNESEFFYNRSNKHFIKKTNGLKGYEKGFYETYNVYGGIIVKIK